MLHRYRRGYGFKSRIGLNFFQALISLLLKWCSLPRRSLSYSLQWKFSLFPYCLESEEGEGEVFIRGSGACFTSRPANSGEGTYLQHWRLFEEIQAYRAYPIRQEVEQIPLLSLVPVLFDKISSTTLLLTEDFWSKLKTTFNVLSHVILICSWPFKT